MFQDSGVEPAEEPVGYAALEALLDDDDEVEDLMGNAGESQGGSVQGPALPNDHLEVAESQPHPSNMDAMETCPMLLDTQIGIEYASEIPATQPRWEETVPTPLHRTSVPQPKTPIVEEMVVENTNGNTPEVKRERDVFNQQLANAASSQPTLLQQWDAIVIGDSPANDTSLSRASDFNALEGRVAGFAQLLAQAESKLSLLSVDRNKADEAPPAPDAGLQLETWGLRLLCLKFFQVQWGPLSCNFRPFRRIDHWWANTGGRVWS